MRTRMCYVAITNRVIPGDDDQNDKVIRLDHDLENVIDKYSKAEVNIKKLIN